VVVYRLIEDGSVRRVQQRVLIDPFGYEYGPAMQPPNELPRLLDRPHWYECDMTLDVVHYQAAAAPMRRWDRVSASGRAGSGWPDRNRTGPHPDSLQPRDVRMINGVLRLLSNHLAVLDYGQRDTLTGLLNRRTFDQSFDKIVERNRALAARCRHRIAQLVRDRGYRPVQVDQRSVRHLFGDDVLLLWHA